MVHPTGDSSSTNSKRKDNGRARIMISPAKSNSASDNFDSFWLLLNFQECVDIYQVKKQVLEYLKRNTMQKCGLTSDDVPRIKKSKASLWLQDAIIPLYESSHILRDGDNVNLLIKNDSNKKEVQSSQLIHKSLSTPEFDSQIPSKPTVSLKRTYSRKSPELDSLSTTTSKKSKKNPLKTKDFPSVDNKQNDIVSEDHEFMDENNVQSKKTKEKNCIKPDSETSFTEKSFITPEIQKLLQQKQAQIENEPQKQENKKDTSQEQKSTTFMSDSSNIEDLPKRKRSRRKKKKNIDELPIKNEKPKPPPNYSLNLPTQSNRVVFEDEEIVTSSSKSENITNFEKKVEITKEVCFTQSCITTEMVPFTQGKGTWQNDNINALNNSKCSKMKIGTSIDSNAKFSELINRTRRHQHKIEEISPLVSIKDKMLAISDSGSAFHQDSNGIDRMSSSCNPLTTKEVSVKSQNLDTSALDSQMNADVKRNESIRCYTKEDLSQAEVLIGTPLVGDIIAFKMMELGQDYTPSLSDFKIGKVLSYNQTSDDVSIELQEALKKRTGRFELDYGNEDEEETEILTSFCMLHEALLLAR